MAAFGRSGTFIVCLAVLFTLLPQNTHHHTMLEGIPSGKTRVLDLSYAISDKLVPWPGDEKFFEAKVNASIEKNGYFTRSFWMLEHYGTHLDAPAHFPPGKATVDQIPAKQLFGPAVVIDVRAESGKDADYQLENLADLSELPETGAFLIVAPIKLEGGSGGPVRVFALLP